MTPHQLSRLAFIGWLTLGCRGNPPTPAPSSSPTTASASAASGVLPTPAASTLAPSHASATPIEAAPRPHCKALTKGRLVAIGAHGGEVTGLATDDGFVFAAVRQGARASVIAFSRDGDKPKELAHVMVSRPPGSLCVDDHAAYFSVGSSLYSAPRAGGPMRSLASAFSRPLAVSGGSVYGVRCGAQERRVDELVQLPRTGGEARVVGSWPRAAGTSCDYRYVAVDGSRAFVSDWTGRRVIGVSLADGNSSEIAVKQAFPQRIALEATSLAFQSAGGIFRVGKQGGEVARVSELGTTPFRVRGLGRPGLLRAAHARLRAERQAPSDLARGRKAGAAREFCRERRHRGRRPGRCRGRRRVRLRRPEPECLRGNPGATEAAMTEGERADNLENPTFTA